MPKIIAIVGTNASGKSSVAVELAKKFHGEIISADSRQVFKGFDLCSGKVSTSERELIPHHLLDIVDIDAYFSLSDYQQLAYVAIDDSIHRGYMPFLVGGTGLYVQAVVDGFCLLGSGPNDLVRNQLVSKSVEELIAIIQTKEEKIPQYLDLHNKKRLIRACEIVLSGRSLLETREKNPLYQVLKIGVTWDISLVRNRIKERLINRLEAGMIDEVKTGLASGIPYDLFYKHGLEFRFIAQYLNNEFDSYDEFVEKLSIAIGQFAKRQMTWFRKDPTIHWLQMEGDYLYEASGLIEEFLHPI